MCYFVLCCVFWVYSCVILGISVRDSLVLLVRYCVFVGCM